jgi:Family of unknown function (DUF6352)
MPDFWPSCGYRLLQAAPRGRLAPSEDFLRSHLLRTELAPLPESSAGELALHQRLLENPRRPVAPEELAAVTDPDTRENYRVWLRFRERLTAAPDLESAYTGLFRGEGVDVPPLFVHQLTQILLRHILGAEATALEARAAETLFRPQRIAVGGDGAVMAADLQTVERYASAGAFGSLGELLARNRTPTRTIELDVLSQDNSTNYWERDERYDFAVSLSRGGGVLEALCRVLERWIAHFLAVEVTIAPKSEIAEAEWVWHVGLDAEATGILNDLYNRVEVAEERLQRLLCLFELRFADRADMLPAIAGLPVTLAMAMDPEQQLKLKPQNLLLNLPLSRPH